MKRNFTLYILALTCLIGCKEERNDLAVGDNYQGGIIAYLLVSGDDGYDPHVQHGLIAAPSDQSTNSEWGCMQTAIAGADGKAIGTGSQNTVDIINGCSASGTAARICYDLVLNGYDDWYLPSKDELDKLFISKNIIGGFYISGYTSSTEYNDSNVLVDEDEDYAWIQSFNTGIQGNGFKNSHWYVRAIRSF